jgi:tetratricopeptide (TPR) repeat protein
MAEAERWTLRALEERPADPRALRLMARAEARRGRHSVAREVYVRLNRDDLEAEDDYLTGLGWVGEDRTETARAAFERALRAEPRHGGALQELAELATGADRLAEASALATRLAAVPGWEERGWVLLGRIRTRLSEPAAAAEAFGRALQRDPALARLPQPDATRKQFARVLLTLDRAHEARAVVRAVARQDAESAWLLSRAELQAGDFSAAAEALRRAGPFRDEHPDEPEPAPYVGSARCADCHRDLHRLVRGSRHARTFWRGDALGHVPLPARPIADPTDPKVTMALERTAKGVQYEAKSASEVRRALIAYALGSGDRGLTPVGRDEAGRARELRLSYYGDIHGWDVTSGHPELSGNIEVAVGRVVPGDFERRCVGCHTTDYRAALDASGPTADEGGIGCERCHGPAGNHLRAVAAKFPDLAIAQPRLASPERVNALCAQCHSPGRQREVRPSDFDAVRFQAVTLTWSRCYTETGKGLSCTTCHSPHHDADTAPAHYESKCLACHAADAPASSLHHAAQPAASRRVSCPVNPRTNCLECHMPASSTAMRHSVFTDHHIRVHREQSP